MARHLAAPLALLLAAVLPSPVFARVKVGKHVAKLSQEKFEYLRKQSGGNRPEMLVEFFAPWCQACQKFAPTYAQVAQIVKQNKLDVKVAAIDADAEKELAERYKISSFPTLLFFPQDGPPIRFEQGVPRSAMAVVEWLRKLQGPAITQVSGPEAVPLEPGSTPAVIITAPIVPTIFTRLAQTNRLTSKWYWVIGFGGITVEVRHWEEPTSVFEWGSVSGSEEEEQVKALNRFLAKHSLPRFGRVDSPSKYQNNHDSISPVHGLVWVLLNSSAVASAAADEHAAAVLPPDGREGAATEGCSAKGGGGALLAAHQCSSSGGGSGGALSTAEDAAAANDRLEDAVQALRPMMLRAASRLKTPQEWGLKRNYTIVYVDAARHAAWAESALTAWSFPSLVVQLCASGCKGFHFADGGRLPGNLSELMRFVKSAEDPLSMVGRPRSERPPEAWEALPIKKLVSLTAEQELRSVPATLLYMMRSDAVDKSSDVVAEEREALEELASWLAQVCEKPPVVAQLDASKNDIPTSLYAKGDFTSLPGLFFVPNDGAKPKTFPWQTDIQRFDTPPKLTLPEILKAEKLGTDGPRRTDEPQRPVSKNLNATAHWVLQQARKVSGLSVPGAQQKVLTLESGGIDAVTDLSSETLRGFLADSQVAFVKFYAPWCGHCKKLDPIFAAAARAARKDKEISISQVAFGRLDATATGAEWVGKQFNVESYPTLLLFRRGEDVTRFNGDRLPRNRKEVLSWLRIELTSALKSVSSEAEIKARRAIVFRGVNRSLSLQVANDFKHSYNFFVVEGTAAEEKKPSLVALDATGGQRASYSGDFEYDDIALWIAEVHIRSEPPPASQLGPVITVVGKTFRDVMFSGEHTILEVFAPWCGHCKELEPIYNEFAQQMQRERRAVVVAKLDGTANEIAYEGFSYTGFPTIFHISPEGNISKVDSRTLEGLVAFVRGKRIPVSPATKKEEKHGTKSGQAQKVSDYMSELTSEATPKMQTGSVVKVVLNTFIDLVFQDDRDVILEVYSPRCPHCKRAEPDYDRLAEDIAKEHGGKIVVAKLDGTANDIPFEGFDLKGYPTIFYVAAGEKKPVQSFVGSYSVEQMRQYVKQRFGQ